MHVGSTKGFGNGGDDTGVGIEGGQYACLDTLPIAFGGVGIDGITVYHLFEPLGRREQVLLRCAPIAEVIGIITTVQHAFQTTETLITSEQDFLGFGGFTAFFL